MKDTKIPVQSKAAHLRAKLVDKTSPLLAVGAHDALSAKLIEEAGFGAIWVSSFGLSTAQKCQPDANVLTMTEVLDIAKNIEATVSIPVIADCDTGYGDAINVMRTVKEFERAGIAAISIEDNPFPKRCSLYPGARAEIAPMQEMVGRIQAAKAAQQTKDFVVIARTEALIAGLGLKEAFKRANAYKEAGADAILIHSKSNTSDEVLGFAEGWGHATPLVVVPTMFPNTNAKELHQAGFQLIIFANQALRASIQAMQETLRQLKTTETAGAANQQIVALERVYDLVGVQQLREREKKFIPQTTTQTRAIIVAAGFEKQLLPLNEDRPKAMLDIKGKSLLERQLETLRACGVDNITVVRGYKSEMVTAPGVQFVENPRYEEEYILSSLFCAKSALEGRVIFLYGDILFDRSVLQQLLNSPKEINLVVDRAWMDRPQTERSSVEGTELVVTSDVPPEGKRFLPKEEPGTILQIGQTLDSNKASGEFIGLAMFSSKGTQKLKALYQALSKRGQNQRFHEASSLKKASFSDFIQEAIDQGTSVASIDIYKGWLEVDTFEDYRRAWSKIMR